MIIGVPKEIKNHEYRVGLVPSSVKILTDNNHRVFIQTQAGAAIGFSDQDYINAGGHIYNNATDIFSQADLIIKVKEPLPAERAQLKSGQILFTFFHLAPDLRQTQDLIQSGAICIAYETITNAQGQLPILTPMSEIAGRMSIQAGANALERSKGGAGILLSGVPGVAPAKVVIIGGGVVGSNAAKMAVGLRADVTILDNHIGVLRRLDNEFQGSAKLEFASPQIINQRLRDADLVIGAVLIPGAAAPKLISSAQIKTMKKGAAVVDVAIDQGGCFETSRPTSHDAPTYLVDDVVHYCVSNMPGGVAKTAAIALNHATLPYVLEIANQGYRQALVSNLHLRNGLNIHRGTVTYKAIADNFQLPFIDPLQALS